MIQLRNVGFTGALFFLQFPHNSGPVAFVGRVRMGVPAQISMAKQAMENRVMLEHLRLMLKLVSGDTQLAGDPFDDLNAFFDLPISQVLTVFVSIPILTNIAAEFNADIVAGPDAHVTDVFLNGAELDPFSFFFS